ncbi:hypothetical protein MX167_001585 [Campylobacter upsaliensis]|nr:hypothetical protein [Campylobacter upsaliensis]
MKTSLKGKIWQSLRGGFSFELRNSKQNRALGVASLRANLAKCGAFRWVCL